MRAEQSQVSTPLQGTSGGSLQLAPLVTGVGAVTPFGWGVRPLVDGVMADRRAIRDLTVLDATGHRTSIAGEVPDAPEEMKTGVFEQLTPRQRARLARTDRFALAAAYEALTTAGLDRDAVAAMGSRVGLFFGSSTGAMREGESYFTDLCDDPGARLASSRLATQQNGGPGDTVARHFGISGPHMTFATACAAATMALEAAWLALTSGEVDVAIAGGSDGLCQLTYAGFNSLRAVSANPCQPFGAERSGLSLGEGAGVLVLESARHARERGAKGLARLLSVASSCDAYHMTAPQPQGDGIARAVARALALADVAPRDVSFLNAHGTGTPHNDAAEATAFGRIFGADLARLPVTSTKGAIGHLLGSAGAVEALVTVCCLHTGRVHPTPGSFSLDPELPIDLVLREARDLPAAQVGVSTNLAFGGANAALVFGKVEPTSPESAE